MLPFASAFLSTVLLDRRGGHRLAVLREFRQLRAFDRLGEEESRAFQQRALARLLGWAGQHVPFYRGKIPRPPIPPHEAFDILKTLPIITRRDLQENPSAFRAEGVKPYYEDATGGSTGSPMRFAVDWPTHRAREASIYWADSLTGWRYGERIAMLWGADKDVKSALAATRANLRWWIDNRRWFNAFDMGEAEMEKFHRALQSFRPHLVVAYASAAEEFARFLVSKGEKPAYPIRAIVSSAEVLRETARRKIEEVFQKPVFNRYGSREFGAVAAECSARSGLHVNGRHLYVEVVSPADANGGGRLVVTYFANTAQPFIRYDTGDWGRLLPPILCSCGRRTMTIQDLAGRASDLIRTASGKIIHGEFFTHLLYGAADHVRNFCFVQQSLTSYQLIVETKEKIPVEVEQQWRHAIREAVGLEAQISISTVDKMPPLPSGKRRFTFSLLNPCAG